MARLSAAIVTSARRHQVLPRITAEGEQSCAWPIRPTNAAGGPQKHSRTAHIFLSPCVGTAAGLGADQLVGGGVSFAQIAADAKAGQVQPGVAAHSLPC